MNHSEPIRLLVVSHALVQTANQARWRYLAREHGVEVRLVVPALWCSGWFGAELQWRAEAVSEERFEVLPAAVTDCRRWGRYRLKTPESVLQGYRPDVMLVYGEEFSLILQQAISLRRRRVPTAALGFFTWTNTSLFRGRHGWLKRWLWRRVCRGTDLALAGNAAGASLLAGAGYPGRIVPQPEIGVDESRYFPDPARREATRQRLALQKVTVGYVGRLAEAKGVADLIAAMEGCGDAALLLVGDGEQRSAFAQQAKELGVDARFTGHVDPAEVPDLLRAMDCLVLPSRSTPTWEEQFGLVLAEAMACGTAVIGSDSGAIPEVIGAAGLIFPEGEREALRLALSRVLASEGYRAELAAAGRARCAGHFSARALAAGTAVLLQELCR